MSYRFDGLGRDIKNTLRMAAAMMTGAFQEKYKQPKFMENALQKMWLKRWLQMIDEGKINEAENELIDTLTKNRETEEIDVQLFFCALEVYEYMNEKDDDFLEKNNYCREEIMEGIQGVLSLSGIILPEISD